MCVLWRKASRKIKKEKNVLRNPVCYALFIENHAYVCGYIFYKMPTKLYFQHDYKINATAIVIIIC